MRKWKAGAPGLRSPEPTLDARKSDALGPRPAIGGEAAGARVLLRRYDGAHGWHGDIWSMIRDDVTWLDQRARAD